MYKKILRYVLLTTAAFVLLSLCWFGNHVSEKDSGRVNCTRLNVIVKDSSGMKFIDREDIDAIINQRYGSIYGKKLDSLDLKKIEDAVCSHTAVRNGQVYVTRDSTLNVIIEQKIPFMRFQTENGGFYIEKDGFIFPLQKGFAANVPVVDGAIPVRIPAEGSGYATTEEEQRWIKGIISLMKYIRSDRTWKNSIIQFHVEESGDLVLIPAEGRERFIFGGPEEFERKFDQMETYYTSIKPIKDSAYYKTVNVKYENQIICRPK